MSTSAVSQLLASAMAHHQAGRLAQAEGVYRQVLMLAPTCAEGLHGLGVIALQAGRAGEAITLLRQAVEAEPGQAHYQNNLGEALRLAGQLEEALAAYRRALAIKADYPEAYSNLGAALENLGRHEEAIEACRRALAIDAGFVAAYFNLGQALAWLERLEEAAAAFRAAVEARPEFAQARLHLGHVLLRLGRREEALAAYREAAARQPDLAAARFCGVNTLYLLERFDEALAEQRRIVERFPGLPEGHMNLGMLLLTLGRVEEAVAAEREAVRCGGDRPRADAHSNLLLALHYTPQAKPEEIFREHVAWGRRYGGLAAGGAPAPFENERDPERRLRVGYISADFREHSCAYFIEPILAHHDRKRVEVFCYANVLSPDAVTARLRGYADGWRSIVRQGLDAIVKQVRADRIDVLVDLCGHTAENRLLVLARRAAPVQMTYLGYPDTTGLAAVDYRVTDAWADPPGETERYHTEELLWLPGGFLCYGPMAEAPEVGPLPAAGRGVVTFGSFSAFAKLSPLVLELWAKLLGRVPGSRLLLKARPLGIKAVREEMAAFFAARGIGPERLDLRGRTPGLTGHLASYGEVDIALDSFPYHGTATTCEALLMGVPVVTMAGRTHASRVGVSLLTQAGLPEFIAETQEQYLRIAEEWAGDPGRLGALRAALRGRLLTSRLTDGARFTRELEESYRTVWHRWCASPGTGACGPAAVHGC